MTAFLLREELELALYSSDGRCMVFHTAVLAPKTTRTTQGVNVMALKPKRTVTQVLPLAETAIVNAARLRIKESDRLASVTQVLNALGAGVEEHADHLVLRGRERLAGGVTFWSNSRSGLGVIKQKAVSL